MRRIWSRIAQTGGTSIVSAAASAAVLVLTARWLGPDGRGIYAVATAWVLMFATLGSINVGQPLVHLVAGRPAEAWLPSALGTILAVGAGMIAVDCGLVALAFSMSDGHVFRNLTVGILILSVAALPFIVANTNLPYLLYALDALRVANLAQLAGAISSVAATVLLVLVFQLGIAGALVAFVIGVASNTAISLVYAWRRASHIRVDWTLARRLLIGGGQLHLNAVGSYLFTQSSVLIMNLYRPVAETGQYQFSIQLFSASLLVSNAIGTVGYGLVATRGADGAWPEQRRLVKQSLLLTLVAVPVAYVLAPVVIPRVAGPTFAPAAVLFQWLTPAMFGATFSAIMGSQWIGRGLFLPASAITIATGVISVACDFVLIPSFGMRGAVASTLVTYAIAALAHGMMAIWVQRSVATRQAAADA